MTTILDWCKSDEEGECESCGKKTFMFAIYHYQSHWEPEDNEYFCKECYTEHMKKVKA